MDGQAVITTKERKANDTGKKGIKKEVSGAREQGLYVK